MRLLKSIYSLTIFLIDPIVTTTTKHPTTSSSSPTKPTTETTTTKSEEPSITYMALDFVFGAIGGFSVVVTVGVIILLAKQFKKKKKKSNSNDIEMNSMSQRDILLHRYNSVNRHK